MTQESKKALDVLKAEAQEAAYVYASRKAKEKGYNDQKTCQEHFNDEWYETFSDSFMLGFLAVVVKPELQSLLGTLREDIIETYIKKHQEGK